MKILIVIFCFYALCNLYVVSSETTIYTSKSTFDVNKSLSNNGIFYDIFSYFKNHKDEIYFIDPVHCNIKRLNNNLEILSSIGKKGQAPGEFEQIIDVFISNKYIYVYDISSKISIFSKKGELKDIINLPGLAYSFAVDEKSGCLIINTGGKENIKIVDIKSKKILSRIELPIFPGIESIKYDKLQHAIPVITENKYIFIRVFAPEILVYDKTFKLLKKIDYVPDNKILNNFTSNYLSAIDDKFEKSGYSKTGLVKFCKGYYYDDISNVVTILGNGLFIKLNLDSISLDFYLLGENNKNQIKRNYTTFFALKSLFYCWSSLHEGDAYIF